MGSTPSWFITVLVCWALEVPQVADTTNWGNETDLGALLEFKSKITGDPFGIVESWNQSVHFCEWHGVKCGHRHQRVILLDLSSQNLTGSVSSFIGNLSFLRVLYLHHNSFIQQLPPDLGRLRRLQNLRLHNNSFDGEIPSNISGCSNLVSFSVSFNNLVGTIPEALGSFSKIQYIFLGKNHFTGNLSPSFGNLSSLVHFSAPFNSINGRIPSSLGQLSKLQFFSMEDNRLSGTIPPSIFNLSSMTIFSVLENQIQGSLPPDLGIHVPNLTYFGISTNQFTGSLPVSMSNLSNLELLLVGDNHLVGKVPCFENLHKLRALVLSLNSFGKGEADDLRFISSLTNASNLQVLGLNNNKFGGMLPESFSNLSTKLTLLHLEYNQISGSFPNGITRFSNLEDLNIGSNQFTGIIPTDIGTLLKLQQFNVFQNNLVGNIPSCLGNISLLITLGLDQNYFEGKIPSSLGNCQRLQSLGLSGNNLSGNIPRAIFVLSSLSISLNLSHNQLTGSLPLQVGNLKNIQGLDVSNNVLSGKIPSTLGSCVGLEKLYLQGNLFWGTIPSSLSSLKGIKFLDLSQNNFSGEIPQYFGNFDLQYLNISFNDFEGEIPKGKIFKNASAFFVTGNSKICGGVSELKLPACNHQRSKKTTSTLAFKISISVVFGILGVILVLSSAFLCWYKKRIKSKSHLDSHNNFSPFKVSYQTLFQSTNGFSSSNLIGMGSFGSVYKGILGEERTKIAVKVFNLLNTDASKSFAAECEALRNIKHRNLIKVLTACSSIDHQGNDFKALVYEYMENGSLEEWLHHDPRDANNLNSKKLNFFQRLNIAIDVARGLDYLHNHSHSSIIHCDLKPSNILLDNELVGHVGDFGLARFLPTTEQDLPDEPTVSIGFRGSFGYVAPEYGMGSNVSVQGDAYSFGIVLLEMFTGKRPTDDMFKDGFDIHNYVEAAWPDRVVEIVDPGLFDTEVEGETGRVAGFIEQTFDKNKGIQESLISIFRVGIACSVEVARERMSIADATVELESTRDFLRRIM